ncbi:putative mannose-6-phosphate isomerase [Monocercomonoides exilis]|uniref:putative mannose-6-phosphate isomerase n=1 Tax=Monocercomonoides exilis TaxID=2049356 RepID=UPI003559E791|nr:putative mannose-6-phosphate isomerase [Monocercomonoides exilis]|eukprot:MONOS_1171.1-p1 / transcript=MONOS_1171.1 / gene=MONOS_1171 / organism=Monocercomonoides_exilis_PA203 / gene_product=mannose-6-phosphate isomerase / transcript_product=mannose-6-phosphate isomerase / location=Mono_scaffold00020:19140-20955(+) / protein_length=491 / sequence_SO=supercontig / SO=protein_coding / is_pseudo=false
MLKLSPAIKNYAWGVVGTDSKVALLSKGVIEQKPYAEMWLGTHKDGCATVHLNDAGDKIDLINFLKENPTWNKVSGSQELTGQLPFLLKVLSVAQPLSIQAHPNKQLAVKLHKEQPQHFPDDNHKPELTFALTPFSALAGLEINSIAIERLSSFESLSELMKTIGFCSEDILAKGGDEYSLSREACRMLTASSDEIKAKFVVSMKQLVDKAQQILVEAKDKTTISPNVTMSLQLFVSLCSATSSPTDTGPVLAAFFLCHRKLSPCDAIFLSANVPHAYLSGDCVEIMATSDNVVRAGLTPKHCDPVILSSMLDDCGVEQMKMIPQLPTSSPDGSVTTFFIPSISDFCLQRACVSASNTSSSPVIIPMMNVPRILLVLGRPCMIEAVHVSKSSKSQETSHDEEIKQEHTKKEDEKEKENPRKFNPLMKLFAEEGTALLIQPGTQLILSVADPSHSQMSSSSSPSSESFNPSHSQIIPSDCSMIFIASENVRA